MLDLPVSPLTQWREFRGLTRRELAKELIKARRRPGVGLAEVVLQLQAVEVGTTDCVPAELRRMVPASVLAAQLAWREDLRGSVDGRYGRRQLRS